MRVCGIVLCGGLSLRMGMPKALLPFGAETMLARIVRQASATVHPVFVVAAEDQALPVFGDSAIIVRDRDPGRGPLEGLRAGLSAAADYDAAFACSCDVPLISPGFISRLTERLEEHNIVAPRFDGRVHPLCAVYRVALLERIEFMLRAGRRRLMDLLDESSVCILDPNAFADIDPQMLSLRNINTPEEYAAVLAETQQSP